MPMGGVYPDCRRTAPIVSLGTDYLWSLSTTNQQPAERLDSKAT